MHIRIRDGDDNDDKKESLHTSILFQYILGLGLVTIKNIEAQHKSTFQYVYFFF